VWLLVVVWTALWATWFYLQDDVHAWLLFPNAARTLLTDGDTNGLHLYATRPDYQSGPVSALVAYPLVGASITTSKIVAATVMTALGVLLIAVIASLTPRGMGYLTRGPLLAGGLLIPPFLCQLTVATGHLDDLLALGFGFFGILQIRRGHPIWAAVLLALAASSKPWAVVFAVALFALPWRMWLRGLATWAVLLLAAWLPFFIADLGTLKALRFQVPVSQRSVLTLVGDPQLIPVWVRPAQLLIALITSGTVARSGLPQLVLVATVASRIVIDPLIAGYYTAGAMLVAFIADRSLCGRVPYFTISTAVLLGLPALLPNTPEFIALAVWLRLLWGIGTLITVVYLGARRTHRQRIEPRVQAALVPQPA